MNNYKVLTLKKKYNFKASSPKTCAHQFLKKYSKFNDEFSVYNPRTNKVYGFYSRKKLLQSGGEPITNVYNQIKKTNNNSLKKGILSSSNNALKTRNKAYNIVSIGLDRNIKDFMIFGDYLSSLNTSNQKKYNFIIEDFLKNVIFKLQFVQYESEFNLLKEILRKFSENKEFIKKAVNYYYDGNTINNVSNIKNIINKINSIKKNGTTIKNKLSRSDIHNYKSEISNSNSNSEETSSLGSPMSLDSLNSKSQQSFAQQFPPAKQQQFTGFAQPQQQSTRMNPFAKPQPQPQFTGISPFAKPQQQPQPQPQPQPQFTGISPFAKPQQQVKKKQQQVNQKKNKIHQILLDLKNSILQKSTVQQIDIDKERELERFINTFNNGSEEKKDLNELLELIKVTITNLTNKGKIQWYLIQEVQDNLDKLLKKYQ